MPTKPRNTFTTDLDPVTFLEGLQICFDEVDAMAYCTDALVVTIQRADLGLDPTAPPPSPVLTPELREMLGRLAILIRATSRAAREARNMLTAGLIEAHRRGWAQPRNQEAPDSPDAPGGPDSDANQPGPAPATVSSAGTVPDPDAQTS